MPDQTLQHDIELLLAFMDGSIDTVDNVATGLQSKIYDIVRGKMLQFDTKNGHFDVSQDWRRGIIEVESLIGNALNVPIWSNTISDFLSTFTTIEERNVSLNRTYNELEVDTSLLTPARKFIYNQAAQSLKQGLKSAYVQPATALLMQQITAGASITESIAMLERWDKGELTNGKFTNNQPTPNLQRYATQIARDSSYSVDRTISGIIKERYDLGDIMYVGGLVHDSRPFCVHMVQHEQPVPMDVVAEYIKLYPQGLIADTTTENFMQRVGGYSCRHKAFAVRKKVPK